MDDREENIILMKGHYSSKLRYKIKSITYEYEYLIEYLIDS